MREIQVAEHKTLKLTNVLARKVDGSELGNLPVVLTQMQNFIRSHNAMPVGPIIQCVKMRTGPNPTADIYFMQQVNQLITRLDPGYEMDAVLRVRNCLYAHYVGPMDHSSLANISGDSLTPGKTPSRPGICLTNESSKIMFGYVKREKTPLSDLAMKFLDYVKQELIG